MQEINFMDAVIIQNVNIFKILLINHPNPNKKALPLMIP